MGHDAQPSVLLGDGQHSLPPETACNGVTEMAPASWQRQRGLCSAPERRGLQGDQRQGSKKRGECWGWKSTREQSNPSVCTVSPELCGAGSRVKTRGAGLDWVLLGRDDVCGATLQGGEKKKGQLPPLWGTDVPPNN